MYAGNGVTKKFPIPDGKDGSAVFLKLPTGKTIRMTQGEGYTVQDGAVYFFAAIPVGVEVVFDEPEESATLTNTSSYVVIYGDGTIREVDEDPVLYLERTQKLLAEVKAIDTETRQYAENTLTQLMRLGETLTSEFDGRLLGYSTRAEDAISEAVAGVRSDLRHEWEATLTEISTQAGKIREGVQIMELLKDEMREISRETAQATKNELVNLCVEIPESVKEIQALKAEIEGIYQDAKYAAESAGREVLMTMNAKSNENTEMWRSLRLKMESDYETLNTKINNRLELLRGD